MLCNSQSAYNVFALDDVVFGDDGVNLPFFGFVWAAKRDEIDHHHHMAVVSER